MKGMLDSKAPCLMLERALISKTHRYAQLALLSGAASRIAGLYLSLPIET